MSLVYWLWFDLLLDELSRVTTCQEGTFSLPFVKFENGKSLFSDYKA